MASKMLKTLLIFAFIIFIFGQAPFIQTLCQKDEAQVFPSWCKYSNPFILPYLLTNVNQTLSPQYSEPICDSDHVESDCYTIMKIRPMEVSRLNVTKRVMSFSLASGNVAMIPFNDESAESFEIFRAHEKKFSFYDALGRNGDYHIVTADHLSVRYHLLKDGRVDLKETKVVAIDGKVLLSVQLVSTRTTMYVALLFKTATAFKIEWRKFDNFDTFAFEWNVFNTRVLKFEPKRHYGDFAANSMTIMGARQSRTLIMMNSDDEVKIVELYGERNINVKFGDVNSENSFLFANRGTKITSVSLFGETVRRVNVTISNCTQIFGNTPSQNMYLLVGLNNDQTNENHLLVKHIPEFSSFVFRDEVPDPLNPARRRTPFTCVNGYFDEETRLCKLPWQYENFVAKRIESIRYNYFGFERNFLSNPVSICDVLQRIDQSLYLICRSIIARQIECELTLIKMFGKTLLQKFWYHNIYATYEGGVYIWGAQFSLNTTNEMVIEQFNNIPLSNPILDFQVSANGQHMFSTYSRKKWQIDSIKRYGQICSELEKNPTNPFLVYYQEICSRDLPRTIDINQFGHYASMCFPGLYCPSLSNNQMSLVNEGYYTLLPRSMQICEPGYYCINGYRSRCPIGFSCPERKLSRPILCPYDPTGQTTCFQDGLHNPAKCPDGTKCDIPYYPPLPISPGYYLNSQKEIYQCEKGDWCSLGRFSNNGSGLLCPKDTFCRDPAVVQPVICQSNVTQFRYCPAGSIHDGLCPPGYFCINQYTKKNCSSYEYCPEGTYVPKPCERGYFCPNTSSTIRCPSGYFCKAGSTAPSPCMIISYCPEGSGSEGNYYIFSVVIMCVIIIISMFYLFQLIGHYLHHMWNKNASTRSSFGKVIKRYIIDIAFDGLGVELRNGKKVLQNVSGEFKHGRMTAVMGLSGSGKTTFLTTLSGRQWVGTVTGKVFFNGKKVNLSNYYKLVGFVPQEDTMLRMMTVYETLYFAARTKLNWRKSNQEIENLVNQVIEELGLEDCRDSLIGDEESRGISGGQRKRVNIGIELVSDPSVLFLDEPTSGLDASAANEVCTMLQRISRTGIPVITVIHQPRYEIFSMFDDVLLLGKGGRIVYLGPRLEAVAYFEKLGYKCPPQMNPADFLMDVTNGDVDRDDNGQFSLEELFESWDEYTAKGPTQEDSSNEVTIQDDPLATGHTLQDEYAKKNTSFFVQLWQCFKRALIQQLRSPLAMMLELLLIFMPGLTLGLVFIDKEYKGPLPPHIIELCPADLRDLCGKPLDDNLLYLAVLMTCSIGLTGAMSSLRNFGGEKVVFGRESTSGMQSLPYYLAKNVAQLPNIILAPCVYMALFYTLASPRGAFWEYYFVMFHMFFAAYGFGYLLSVVFDENVAKLAAVVGVLLFQMSAGGGPVLSEFESMPIPVKYLPYTSFSRWGQEMIYILEIRRYGLIYDIRPSLKSWSYNIDDFWKNYGILLAYGIGFRILAYLVLLNFQPTSYLNIILKFVLDTIYFIRNRWIKPFLSRMCSKKKVVNKYQVMEEEATN